MSELRSYTVEPEQLVYQIQPENRTLVIEAEISTYTVGAEARVINIQQELRSLIIEE